jgi:hypothetical protein
MRGCGVRHRLLICHPTTGVDVPAAVVAQPYVLSSVACEVVEPQSNIVSSSATPTVVVDMSVTIVGSPSPLLEVVELLAVGVMMPFVAKPPDIAPLEMGLKGALPCSRRDPQASVLVIASQARWPLGGAKLIQGCVLCVPVVALLLLLLLVAPVYSVWPSARRSKFLMVTLDVGLGFVTCGLVFSCLVPYCCPVFHVYFFILLCFFLRV